MAQLKPLFKITEKGLQDAVVQCAKVFGWSVYHTYDSRRSEPGFPDLVLARQGRIIFAELKSETGRLTSAQVTWQTELAPYSCVWRPDDWTGGLIEAQLR